jgi:hypothetical protein
VIMDHASCQKLMIQSKPPEFWVVLVLK